MRDAEEYTVSVRREIFEDELLYVARIEELPDVEEYADTFEIAYNLALDTIRTTQKVFFEKGMPFPSPKEFQSASVSGRVTLRLPRSVHAKCIYEAEAEGVSLNSYILTCITSYRDRDIENIAERLFSSMQEIISLPRFMPFGHTENMFGLSKIFTQNIKIQTDTDDYEDMFDKIKFDITPHDEPRAKKIQETGFLTPLNSWRAIHNAE